VQCSIVYAISLQVLGFVKRSHTLVLGRPTTEKRLRSCTAVLTRLPVGPKEDQGIYGINCLIGCGVPSLDNRPNVQRLP